MRIHGQVLISLRQIIRAIDLHSKKLERESGLTGPQLLVLKTISEKGPITSGALSRSISLSQATVTTILDRLERKGYLIRRRDDEDKRKNWISLTEVGQRVLTCAPTLLQDSFVAAFAQLKDWEQSLILSSLQRVAGMMQASELEAAPVLDSNQERLIQPEEGEA
ncbi:MAG: MarR family transcriptional regulator [Gammaproteobacteria bacterium]|nr:MarR family transcriptional regulator [Gammaproteobacteria bacterium]MBU1653586.1 MarR family transcriptional regulator [Gammaproteobacteria bacterium]MBU1960507.1 MarR family transcriptional regulator [Gammaproteobacteria bacterium]